MRLLLRNCIALHKRRARRLYRFHRIEGVLANIHGGARAENPYLGVRRRAWDDGWCQAWASNGEPVWHMIYRRRRNSGEAGMVLRVTEDPEVIYETAGLPDRERQAFEGGYAAGCGYERNQNPFSYLDRCRRWWQRGYRLAGKRKEAERNQSATRAREKALANQGIRR